MVVYCLLFPMKGVRVWDRLLSVYHKFWLSIDEWNDRVAGRTGSERKQNMSDYYRNQQVRLFLCPEELWCNSVLFQENQKKRRDRYTQKGSYKGCSFGFRGFTTPYSTLIGQLVFKNKAQRSHTENIQRTDCNGIYLQSFGVIKQQTAVSSLISMQGNRRT